jgi:hypothetical protein
MTIPSGSFGFLCAPAVSRKCKLRLALHSTPTALPSIFLTGRWLANSRGGKRGQIGPTDPVPAWFFSGASDKPD